MANDIDKTEGGRLNGIPTVMMWNRLEGRPRTNNFEKALKAEVRDALWMITRQWQMGELKADDAGSPVFAKVHLASSRLNQYKAAGNAIQNYQDNIPLEVKVEQKKIPFIRNGRKISIDIRLQMGYYWLKLLSNKNLNYKSAFIQAYPFLLPQNKQENDTIYSSKDTWQQYLAISGRCMDGYKLYEYLKSNTHQPKAYEHLTPAVTDQHEIAVFNEITELFIHWFQSVYHQPEDEKDNAWLPDRLEYQFECTAAGADKDIRLNAETYYHGHLDWYAFDISEHPAGVNRQPDAPPVIKTLIPSHVTFDGMPDTRWWKFEDGKTSFGDIRPSTTDLSKLLLMQFGLVFANDWFMIPCTLPVGSLSVIESLTIKNNFGETSVINAAEAGGTANNVWSMFKLRSGQQNNTLFLTPSAIKVQEGNPLEEIVLIRDEMSNMVWGIETIVPLPTGKGDRGSENALRIKQFHENRITSLRQTRDEVSFYLNYLNSLSSLSANLISAKSALLGIRSALAQANPDIYTLVTGLRTAVDDLVDQGELVTYQESKKDGGEAGYKAKISYLAMTDVPENWIPFVPVHVKNDNRKTQLQRASMMRIIPGDTTPPVKIKPVTSILREGLEEVPDSLPYHIHEEEVPRSGVRVTQSFQRTRWTNGEVFVWLGMQKKTGRGEGSSALAFDQIKNVP